MAIVGDIVAEFADAQPLMVNDRVSPEIKERVVNGIIEKIKNLVSLTLAETTTLFTALDVFTALTTAQSKRIHSAIDERFGACSATARRVPSERRMVSLDAVTECSANNSLYIALATEGSA